MTTFWLALVAGSLLGWMFGNIYRYERIKRALNARLCKCELDSPEEKILEAFQKDMEALQP